MFRKAVRDEVTGRLKSVVEDFELPVARIKGTLPCMVEDARQIYVPALVSWQQKRQCAWCGEVFSPKYSAMKLQRFCGTSCSAKWRMNTAEHKAKVHNAEVAAKRGQAKSAWFRSDDPKAKKELERITNLNPMSNPETRAKVSARLQAIGHKPSLRGGNGKPLPIPQITMQEALAGGWEPEYAISLGKKEEGYPTCYKVDLGNPTLKIAIELDGHSHHSRKEQDLKKDAKLCSLGWRVLRFWNKDVMNWAAAGMPVDTHISTVLKNNGVCLK